MKKIFFATLVLGAILFSGCSTVPLEPKEISLEAQSFNAPPEGSSGLYIYRDSILGSALKKDIFVDNKCVGASAPKVFFYQAVKGDEEHEITTQSEFSPNKLSLRTQSGKNYFIRQYIKLGVFLHGADLELIEEEKGKKAILELEMAKEGMCVNSVIF